MTALPKTVPYLYAVCREEDARKEFAEEAAHAFELYAKLSFKRRRLLDTMLEALVLLPEEQP